jgi:uncharacterized protein (TIGR04255 family)
MSLNFPRVPEIRFGKPPLVEVVCQVRFPPILRILKEDPSEFQDRIRHRFPELAMEQGLVVRMPGLGAGETPAADMLPKIYRFRTIDGVTAISLAADFCALSTQPYSHWRVFAQDLAVMEEATKEIYNPAYATRIGLRYVNRLTLANTGLRTVAELIKLIRPELTGPLCSDAWAEPANMLCQLVLTDGDPKLAIRTAYGQEAGEPFFLLDFDYFEEGKLSFDNIVQRCYHYHEIIYGAFRWSLLEKALDAFEPIAEETTP